jgi:hypothetical protein
LGIAYTGLFPLQEEKETYVKHRHDGYYLAIGADYRMTNNHSFFLRFVYEDYPLSDNHQFQGNDKIKMPHIKIGYTM